jgi:hypothetical protein
MNTADMMRHDWRIGGILGAQLTATPTKSPAMDFPQMRNYQFSVTGANSTSLAYDLNGNMTSDGTNTYSWDAANRLIRDHLSGNGE